MSEGSNATSIKQSAHWVTSLLGSIEMGILITDCNFKVEMWNRFLENHSQLSESDIVGTDLFGHFPEIDTSWLKSKCKPVVALATPVFNIWEQRPYLFAFKPARPFTTDTEHMFQNVTITPLQDDSGKVTKLCFLIYDVTDQALNKQRIEGLNQQLETISRVDGLTGLNNRRYWQERFDREFKLSQRNKSCHTLMMLDIDHFKKVNDTYGHQTGDEVIKHLAKVIKLATRETDIPGRYGGEEFIILLTDTTAKNAKIVAERIRKAVSMSVVEYEGQSINYTCSVGVAENCGSFKQSNMWVEAADKALYQAKENGRNQVIVHASS